MRSRFSKHPRRDRKADFREDASHRSLDDDKCDAADIVSYAAGCWGDRLMI